MHVIRTRDKKEIALTKIRGLKYNLSLMFWKPKKIMYNSLKLITLQIIK